IIARLCSPRLMRWELSTHTVNIPGGIPGRYGEITSTTLHRFYLNKFLFSEEDVQAAIQIIGKYRDKVKKSRPRSQSSIGRFPLSDSPRSWQGNFFICVTTLRMQGCVV